MDKRLEFKQDFDKVASAILNLECAEVVLEIKPLHIRADSILFGCYIPHMPRMTNILSGRMLIRRISTRRTELRLMDLPEWASPIEKCLFDAINLA